MAPSASPARRRSLATSWPPRCAQVRDKKKQSNEQRTPRGRASVDRSESRPIAFHAPSSSHASLSLSLSLFLKTPSKQAVADIVRTTLGPRAMLKMLLDASGGETEALEMEKEARERGAARDRVFCRRSFHSSFFLPQPPRIPPPKKTKLLQNQIQASCSPTTAMPSSVKSTCRILRPR